MRLLVLLVLLSVPVFACVSPTDNFEINESVTLCNDVFYLDDGISIVASDVFVDCAGAILKGNYRGAGVKIAYVDNVTVENCRIVNYETGLLAIDASKIFFTNNHLVRNLVGTSLFLVKDSAIYNFDVSLRSPVFVEGSENNVLSSTNRFFSGLFCINNYCNRPRSVVELAQQPVNDALGLKNWLYETLAYGDVLY